MDRSKKIVGWKIRHSEQLQYRTKAGSPMIHLKFYHYPKYRQKVQINNFPAQCRMNTKGNNSFFIFNQKVHMKGSVSLERTITVLPITTIIKSRDWGNISNYSSQLQQKYRENSKFWPISFPGIKAVSEQEWFHNDSLFDWMKESSCFINSKIPFRENQDERLGAYRAYLSGIGDCDEFTDLFITLARSRGIPCRRLTGLFIAKTGAYVEPHAWVEIFSPKLGWVTIDLALNNLGNHTINYIVLKIEEFNPELPDYQVKTKHSSVVHYHWERPSPSVTPIF
jgi:hypothetical protein